MPKRKCLRFWLKSRHVSDGALRSHDRRRDAQIRASESYFIIIKLQALFNYQHGLNKEIRLVVLSQKYNTLQKAMAEASVDEKVKKPKYRNNYQNKSIDARQIKNLNPQRCGNMRNYARDCCSKFVLLRTEGNSRINLVKKFCQHCKKFGHVRNECRLLHGRTSRENVRQREACVNQAAQCKYYNKNSAVKKYKRKDKSEKDKSNDEKKRR